MTTPVRFIHGPCKSHWRQWVRPLSPHQGHIAGGPLSSAAWRQPQHVLHETAKICCFRYFNVLQSEHFDLSHRVRGHCTCTMGRNTGLSWALQCGQPPAVAAASVLPMVGSLAPYRRNGPEIARFHSPTASRPQLNL